MMGVRTYWEDGLTKFEVEIGPRVKLVGEYFAMNDENVLMLPGFSQHKSSLRHLANRLHSKGIGTYTLDLLAHGESTGEWTFQAALDATRIAEKEIRHHFGLSSLGGFGKDIGGVLLAATSTQPGSSIESLCMVSVPDSLEKIIPENYFQEKLSFTEVRKLAILQDETLASNPKNKNYRELSHAMYIEGNPKSLYNDGYKAHVQQGALKVRRLEEFREDTRNPQDIIPFFKGINVPTLVIYGGKDNAVSRKGKISARIYGAIPPGLATPFIEPYADANMNHESRPDDYFNHSPGLQHISEKIAEFFYENLKA